MLTKVASGVHLKSRNAFNCNERAKGSNTLHLPYQIALVRDMQGRVQEHLNFKPSSPTVFFFFKKESWLFWCPDSSFFIMYLCCHILVQNQLTSALWVSNICQALRCWLLWRYIEITHSENMNWQCKTPDVNMTALSICSDITFLLLSPSLSTKMNRKKCPGAIFWWWEAGVGVEV